MLEGKDDDGFNAHTNTYENLSAPGVIDPTKVIRLALQNAATVSGLMLTTEADGCGKARKEESTNDAVR
jgi:chaperonin GroEL